MNDCFSRTSILTKIFCSIENYQKLSESLLSSNDVNFDHNAKAMLIHHKGAKDGYGIINIQSRDKCQEIDFSCMTDETMSVIADIMNEARVTELEFGTSMTSTSHGPASNGGYMTTIFLHDGKAFFQNEYPMFLRSSLQPPKIVSFRIGTKSAVAALISEEWLERELLRLNSLCLDAEEDRGSFMRAIFPGWKRGERDIDNQQMVHSSLENHIIKEFPGFLDGETSINGADLVSLVTDWLDRSGMLPKWPPQRPG